MKTEKRRNSALKKLIPAVAMLATSAVMLSTATYAWFTMNKEVQMTGLNMTATVGEGIEIALAEIADDKTSLNFSYSSNSPNTCPKDSLSNSWKSSVIVGNYYDSFGKIKPSSSADGKKFFDATNASDGGKVASKFKEITVVSPDATESNKFIVTKGSWETNDSSVDVNGTTGYYVDIPVHIRTSKVVGTEQNAPTTGDVYYKMVIDDSDDQLEKDLFKAVRVAFINKDNSATVISAADNSYYDGGAVTAIDTNNDGFGTKGVVPNLKAMNDNGNKAVFASATANEYKNSKGEDSGLDIPYAEGAGKYGHLDFTVRVWLEGESTFCYDEKAGQSWNINLAFSLGEFDTTNATP